MLGLSLTKILFTILVIVAVWRAFARVGRLQAQRQALRQGEGARPGAKAASRPRASERPPPAPVVDLVECPSCGSYVPRGERCRCRRV